MDPKKPKPKKKKVDVDEPRQTAGSTDGAFELEGDDGVDPLAEELGEEFVENVTGADDAASENRAERLPEENGGPFVISPAATEFADDIDASNPPDATVEAEPTTSRPRP